MLKTVETRQSSRTLAIGFLYLCAFTLAIQALHLVEHTAQVVQKFVLHSTEAHGLIGRLDLEPVHFGFNLVYLIFLGLVFAGWVVCRHEISKCSNYWATFATVLFVGLVFQMWHVVEHSVKLAQFLNTGMQGTPGILGAHFDGVLMHFSYNWIVYLPLVLVVSGSRLYKLAGAKL